jgi:hypothetical protein
VTTYIVLKLFRSPVEGWEIIGSADASGPVVARKAVDAGEGEFLAVPVRNATFIHGETETPEPVVRSIEVEASKYLDVQEQLPDGDSDIPLHEGSLAAGGDV